MLDIGVNGLGLGSRRAFCGAFHRARDRDRAPDAEIGSLLAGSGRFSPSSHHLAAILTIYGDSAYNFGGKRDQLPHSCLRWAIYFSRSDERRRCAAKHASYFFITKACSLGSRRIGSSPGRESSHPFKRFKAASSGPPTTCLYAIYAARHIIECSCFAGLGADTNA